MTPTQSGDILRGKHWALAYFYGIGSQPYVSEDEMTSQLSPRPPQFTMLLFVYQDISLHYCTTLTGFIAHRLREKT